MSKLIVLITTLIGLIFLAECYEHPCNHCLKLASSKKHNLTAEMIEITRAYSNRFCDTLTGELSIDNCKRYVKDDSNLMYYLMKSDVATYCVSTGDCASQEAPKAAEVSPGGQEVCQACKLRGAVKNKMELLNYARGLNATELRDGESDKLSLYFRQLLVILVDQFCNHDRECNSRLRKIIGLRGNRIGIDVLDTQSISIVNSCFNVYTGSRTEFSRCT